MALVEIHQLTKQYTKGDQTITPLEDAELQVQEHEFVSLMGASGSGKSTLLNMIAGIDRPLSGSIVIDGTDITQLSRSQLASWRTRNVGYIFQFFNCSISATSVSEVTGIPRATVIRKLDKLVNLGFLINSLNSLTSSQKLSLTTINY